MYYEMGCNRYKTERGSTFDLILETVSLVI